MEGSATLIVERSSNKDIGIRGLQVLLDGVEIGNLSFGGSVSCRVAPGSHRLKVTNSLFSRDDTFSVKADETVSYVAGNAKPGVLSYFLMAIAAAPYRVFLERGG